MFAPIAKSIKLQLMKKSNAITLAFLAHAPVIVSVNTLLIEFARSRDDGKCDPGVCEEKTILQN